MSNDYRTELENIDLDADLEFYESTDMEKCICQDCLRGDPLDE